MIITLLIATIFYCFLILIILFLFARQSKIEPLLDSVFISVVISARNEEKRIKPTLESLLKIKYPHDKYEIIFVDDASTDNTVLIIEKYLARNNNWQLLRIYEKKDLLKGKKAALTKAIEMAKGEIILTTDADCIVPENWLTEMAGCFDDKTSMVLGYSRLQKRKGWLDKLLVFDNLFSGIMIAAPTLLGFPMSSVGRNMAYRKKDFIEVGGFDSLVQYKSGDDVHLTELFRRVAKGKIKFCFNKNSFTLSNPPDTFKEIFHQQIRKNSKVLKKSMGSVFLTLFVFLYHLCLVLFPFLYGISNFWLMLLAIKLFIEIITLIVSAIKFSERRIIPFLLFFQIFYPIYVMIMALVGIFQHYEWKK